MRTTAWVIALSGAILTVAFVVYRPTSVATILDREWWLIPLSASTTSTLVLGAAAAIGHSGRTGSQTSLPTLAYLVTGPSVGLVNLSSILPLGASPPDWVGFTMPILLLTSAWIYYSTLDDHDDVSSVQQDSVRWTFLPRLTD